MAPARTRRQALAMLVLYTGSVFRFLVGSMNSNSPDACACRAGCIMMNCCTLLEPILNNRETIEQPATRGARGDAILLRTHWSLARLAASLHSAPKSKNFSLQSNFRWRGLGRSRQKMERKILCFGFAALFCNSSIFQYN